MDEGLLAGGALSRWLLNGVHAIDAAMNATHCKDCNIRVTHCMRGYVRVSDH